MFTKGGSLCADARTWWQTEVLMLMFAQSDFSGQLPPLKFTPGN